MENPKSCPILPNGFLKLKLDRFLKNVKMAITLQLGQQQDLAVKGKVGKMDYVGVLDGHGRSKCIDILRGFNFDEIAVKEDPAQEILERLHGIELYNSGSTFTFARITDMIVEVFNVGDSQKAVIVNGELVFMSKLHNFHNEEEIERTKPFIQRIEMTYAPFPVSESVIHNVRSDVGIFKVGENLVPSQSFGHNNMTGICAGKTEIPFRKDDKVRVICGSDGFWDMYMEKSEMLATATPEELVAEAERRWRQTWTYVSWANTVQTSYGTDFDDIAISVWEN
jgi:hypothetical protein